MKPQTGNDYTPKVAFANIDPQRYGQTTPRRWMLQFEQVEADPHGIPAHWILQAQIECNTAYDVPDWVKQEVEKYRQARYGDIPAWQVDAFTGETYPDNPQDWAIWHWQHRQRRRKPHGCQLPLF